MSISARVVPRFPARVSGADGVAVEKANGAFTVKQDWGALAEDLALPNTADTYFGIWKQSGDTYTRISADTLLPYVASGIVTLNITRAQIATTKIPLNSFAVSGHTTAGDKGTGAVYVRGSSSGTDAIQDLNGTWWNLALPGYAERGWFGASGSANTAASIAAMEAAGGGVLHFGAGTDSDPYNAHTGTWPEYPSTILEYVGDIPYSAFVDEQSANASNRAKHALFGQNDGDHSGSQRALKYTHFRPKGSGINGPASADLAEVISLIKHDWLNPLAEKGEIDGHYYVIRQGGPDAEANDDKSDAAAFLGDIVNIGNSGFVGLFEASIANIARGTFLPTRNIVVQCGIINSVISGQQSYGVVYISKTGANDFGILMQCEPGASWTHYARFQTAAGVKRFEVKDDTFTIGPTGYILNQNGNNIAKVSNNFWQAYKSARPITGSFGLSYELDLGRTILITGSSATTINLPNNGNVGWWCDVVLIDSAAGPITFSPGSGATLIAKSGHNKLSTQYGRVRLEIVENATTTSATYLLSGDTST